MTRDYKNALAEMPEDFTPFVCAGYLQAKRETIKEALKIADRLQSGEVSEDMLEIGYSEGDGNTYARSIFIAMAQQLIKEVKNEP